jgi:3-hydroxyisobutyrate dehydrogenase-like beta-hydroxyacid dehydrogenase
MKVGVIGTGMMGAQLAIRLSKGGHEVTVFNRNRMKAQIVHPSTAENRIKMARTPAEVGKKF